MSNPLGMKAQRSDKRLIPSALHHIHMSCSNTPYFQSKLSLVLNSSVHLNKSHCQKFAMSNFTPPKRFCTQKGYCFFLCVLFSAHSFPWSNKRFSGHYFGLYSKKIQTSCFNVLHISAVPWRVTCTWPAKPRREWHLAKVHAGLTCCILEEKDNRPVVCQLRGYNYQEEGGEMEFSLRLRF